MGETLNICVHIFCIQMARYIKSPTLCSNSPLVGLFSSLMTHRSRLLCWMWGHWALIMLDWQLRWRLTPPNRVLCRINYQLCMSGPDAFSKCSISRPGVIEFWAFHVLLFIFVFFIGFSGLSSSKGMRAEYDEQHCGSISFFFPKMASLRWTVLELPGKANGCPWIFKQTEGSEFQWVWLHRYLWSFCLD